MLTEKSHSKITQYLCEHRQEIVNTLCELVRIPSVQGQPENAAPFGRSCAELLAYVNTLFTKYDLEAAADISNGYLLSCNQFDDTNSVPGSIGIFAHGDVVPAGEGWSMTDPFTPIEQDGFLIGRGVCDNKAGILIALYCARIIRELSLPFQSQLILYVGSNEESGMQDIRHYVATHQAPDFSLVPDTAFPLYRGNKGIYRFYAVSVQKPASILEWDSGQAFNVVLGQSNILLRYSEALYRELLTRQNDTITVAKAGDAIRLSAIGLSRHAAIPQGSVNAGGLIASLLASCNTLPAEERQQFDNIAAMLSGIYGEAFCIEYDDREFGPLTCTNGMIRSSADTLMLSFDIRHGFGISAETLTANITKALAKISWKLELITASRPFLLSETHPLVQGLLETYQDHTGDNTAKACLNAGGTYARYLPCAVETGTSLGAPTPLSLPAGHGNVHQPDECISITGLLNAIELTVKMLLKADHILHPERS